MFGLFIFLSLFALTSSLFNFFSGIAIFFTCVSMPISWAMDKAAMYDGIVVSEAVFEAQSPKKAYETDSV